MQRRGLSTAEAAARLRREGPNALPDAAHRSLARVALDVAREPMFALLLGAGALYLLLGDLAEALVLLVFACLSVAIAVAQEARTERALEALRDLSSPRALVVRDGERRRIPGREVVRGDLLVLAEGDRVPADARLLAAEAFEVDESLLTGESLPVAKRAGAAPGSGAPPRPGDDPAAVFSGSLVVRGTGEAVVQATGPRTELGRIGAALGGIKREPPRMRAQTAAMVRSFAVLGLLASLGLGLLTGLLRGDWLQAALGGIALAMAMLPEEFPLVLTVFAVMGARRIARVGVLLRQASALQTLGATTVLCTDKTGTLTRNRMAVALGQPEPPLDGPGLLRLAADASEDSPFDAMEVALRQAAPEAAGGTPLRHYGLRPDLPAMGRAWAAGSGARLAAKGAPEAILRLCAPPPAVAERIAAAAAALAARGLRVLGVAEAAGLEPARLPARLEEAGLVFRGLVGLADPLRPQVPEAVAECRTAGIRVVIVTGDHPDTARAIAAEAGLDTAPVVTGAELAGLDAAGFAARAGSAAILARVLPEQKLRLVQVLKAAGEVVAMTGDGVNDAPALKASHVGVAMGARGTDVAREAAAAVLLEDDFGAILRAIRLGRRIIDNLRKAMGYIVALHVPIAGMAFLPLAFGLPPVLGPLHIAFLEMVVDPVCSFAFEAEPEEADVMRRPPEDPQAALLAPGLIAWGVVQGVVAFATTGVLYLWAWGAGLPEPALRAIAFTALVAALVALILVNRSFSASPLVALARPNPVLLAVLGTVGLLLALVLVVPPVAALFRFEGFAAWQAGLALANGAAVLLILEAGKRLRNALPRR
ncbi:cation-translocating P-type ATPase [Paracraurococcus lichenis]|uniref:Cation-translocating P-type ATPase n=1 Tax=Paracraurococcus lichenis TaxID=3064888 RepID=A0ABT9DZF0_9PROT|nr:cation-translocating P-type ATPase [Paracraurococcus sp. LOR1-02]MDO9709282.1 cation-translocating P-type ATPase [Paracraurococcus sp. LOR1-02]